MCHVQRAARRNIMGAMTPGQRVRMCWMAPLEAAISKGTIANQGYEKVQQLDIPSIAAARGQNA